MIQLVKAGVLDIAKVSASSMEQFNSAYAIFSMPYVFESTEQYFAVMNQSEAVQEIFKSTYDQGFFAIGWFDSGSRSIYTTKDGPCEGPADLKGLKIRTQDSPTSIAMIRAMGGSATPMSSGETYTGLQQGIIDGAENNETVLVQDGHGEVCKSYTYTQHQMVPDIVIISTETWESLDETEQSAIVNGMTQGNEAHEAVWRIWCRRTLTVPRRWASSSTPSTRRPLSRLPSPCATSSVLRAPTMPVITRTSCPMYRLDEEGSIPC